MENGASAPPSNRPYVLVEKCCLTCPLCSAQPLDLLDLSNRVASWTDQVVAFTRQVFLYFLLACEAGATLQGGMVM